MKMMAKSGYIMVMVCCFLAAFSPVWAADPSTQLGKDNVLQKTIPTSTPVETKVISCAKEITVQARLSDSYLQSSIDASAKSTNYNDVVLSIYGSNAFGDFNVDCYYKSKNGDIPNIVYRIPCKRPKKGATSYEHSYWCIKN